MNGVVQGGWEFVIAAYTITGVALLAYGVSLIARLKEPRKHD
ncbi:MAG TPA: hypothetical protein VND45_15160 [Thermoanaerobaculia bacterium]|jgi:hypothetical protein|nr:hypothetical protein [Thermoanaerobaculia bacterium]